MGAAAAGPVQLALAQRLDELALGDLKGHVRHLIRLSQPGQPAAKGRPPLRGSRLAGEELLHALRRAQAAEGPGQIEAIERQAHPQPLAGEPQQPGEICWGLGQAATIEAGQLGEQQHGHAAELATGS